MNILDYYLAKHDLETISRADVQAFAVINDLAADSYNDLLWLVALKIHGPQTAQMISGAVANFTEKFYLQLAATSRQRKDQLFPAELTDQFVQAVAELASQQKAFKKKLQKLPLKTKKAQEAALKEQEQDLMANPQWQLLQQLLKLIRADPAPPAWIIDSYVKGGIQRLEDIGSRLKVALKDWAWLKKKGIIAKQVKLEQFCGLVGCLGREGLETFLEQYVDKLAEYHGQLAEATKAAAEGKLIYESAQIKVIRPTTKEAAIYYGRGTKWCTAVHQKNMFELYNKNGPLYIIIPKKPSYIGEKYQLHGVSNQYMNEKDVPISIPELIKKFPDILNVSVDLPFLPMEKAIASNELDKIKPFLKNLDIVEIYIENPERIELFIKLGLDVNMVTRDGHPLLRIAAWAGQKDVVKLLLDAGADLNIQDTHGYSALMLAAEKDHTDVVKLLLDAGADINIQDTHGYSALMLAAEKDHTDVVKLLLDAGADPNIKDTDGNSALMLAAEKDHTDVVKLLLDAGIDINIQNKDGHSALMLAAWKDHKDVVKLLLDAGADINIQEKVGQTALMATAEKDHTDVAKLLLDAGADINIQDKNGYSALMIAANYGNKNVVKLLLDAGADINIQNKDGHSALMIAADKDNKDIVKLLLDAGADPNIQNNQKVTPLMIAAWKDHKDVVKLLLDAGADINIRGSLGHTAMKLAAIKHHKNIVELLKTAGARIDKDL